MLFAKKSDSVGVRAGLPWFFQFWQRDEAVSLKGLSQFDQKTAAKIFWRQLAELRAGDFHSDTADGIGWLFLRASDFYRSGKFNVKETAIIRESLENSIKYLLESNTRRGLAVNGRGQTWMDSLDRSGACIEIQALRLNMYSLAADLAIDQKQAKYYRELEENLKNNVRILFFDGNNLIDRFDTDNDQADYAIRPNIFLAAYIYPDLLSKKEWAIVFESALAKLWLDWGGLATLDKTDARFCVHDTGENPTAYHNGDSWFWVNNIAAIVMARTDKKRFKNYIDKIFEASKNDILWNGALGSASEISSAEIYASVGCANQAWSNATFLELCQELIK
jgi:glycogen debranching enzyme